MSIPSFSKHSFNAKFNEENKKTVEEKGDLKYLKVGKDGELKRKGFFGRLWTLLFCFGVEEEVLEKIVEKAFTSLEIEIGEDFKNEIKEEIKTKYSKWKTYESLNDVVKDQSQKVDAKVRSCLLKNKEEGVSAAPSIDKNEVDVDASMKAFQGFKRRVPENKKLGEIDIKNCSDEIRGYFRDNSDNIKTWGEVIKKDTALKRAELILNELEHWDQQQELIMNLLKNPETVAGLADIEHLLREVMFTALPLKDFETLRDNNFDLSKIDLTKIRGENWKIVKEAFLHASKKFEAGSDAQDHPFVINVTIGNKLLKKEDERRKDAKEADDYKSRVEEFVKATKKTLKNEYFGKNPLKNLDRPDIKVLAFCKTLNIERFEETKFRDHLSKDTGEYLEKLETITKKKLDEEELKAQAKVNNFELFKISLKKDPDFKSVKKLLGKLKNDDPRLISLCRILRNKIEKLENFAKVADLSLDAVLSGIVAQIKEVNSKEVIADSRKKLKIETAIFSRLFAKFISTSFLKGKFVDSLEKILTIAVNNLILGLQKIDFVPLIDGALVAIKDNLEKRKNEIINETKTANKNADNIDGILGDISLSVFKMVFPGGIKSLVKGSKLSNLATFLQNTLGRFEPLEKYLKNLLTDVLYTVFETYTSPDFFNRILFDLLKPEEKKEEEVEEEAEKIEENGDLKKQLKHVDEILDSVLEVIKHGLKDEAGVISWLLDAIAGNNPLSKFLITKAGVLETIKGGLKYINDKGSLDDDLCILILRKARSAQFDEKTFEELEGEPTRSKEDIGKIAKDLDDLVENFETVSADDLGKLSWVPGVSVGAERVNEIVRNILSRVVLPSARDKEANKETVAAVFKVLADVLRNE